MATQTAEKPRSRLKAKAPETIEKRFKCLIYGPPGVGKTTATLQFPRPYFIDTERGAENDQYVKLLTASNGAYLATTDPDEMIAQLKALLEEEHEFRTLVIDPLTIIYDDLLDRGMDTHGADFGRYKMPANRTMKHFRNLLFRLDMNVVITSHAKPKWVRTKDSKGKDTVAQEGMTFDCYDKLDYIFDLVIRVDKRGNERVGIVEKTRLAEFPEGDIFPFTYEAIAERYGGGKLERKAAPVELANAEQVAAIQEMLADRVNGEELLGKWLDKANAADLSELPADVAAKCINFLRGAAK